MMGCFPAARKGWGSTREARATCGWSRFGLGRPEAAAPREQAVDGGGARWWWRSGGGFEAGSGLGASWERGEGGRVAGLEGGRPGVGAPRRAVHGGGSHGVRRVECAGDAGGRRRGMDAVGWCGWHERVRVAGEQQQQKKRRRHGMAGTRALRTDGTVDDLSTTPLGLG